MKTLSCAILLLLGCGGGAAPPAASPTAATPLDDNAAFDDATPPAAPSDPTPAPPTTPNDPAPSQPPAPSTPPSTTPKNVSFAQVADVFERRGCVSCHSGNGIGRDLGDLTLDGGEPLIFRELVQEQSPNYKSPRVLVKSPEASLVLTVPSLRNAPDKHPVTVFQSTADADYQLILVWIVEGARSY